MMKFLFATATLLLSGSLCAAGTAMGDFDAEVEQASSKLRPVMPTCEKQMTAGDFAGANAAMLAVFPEATRTPAQSYLLGNVLFSIDARQAHALHEAAARGLPNNPAVQWEWALDQHRAGEYAGALAAYESFSKAQPRFAGSYALQADCLLRLNRIDDAVVAWKKSEDAPDGTIESMEELVCAVHSDSPPHARRADLLATATQKHDVQAAADLIALDCDFQRDWWNGGPHRGYLAHDVPAVVAALSLPKDDLRARAIACAADCALADRADAAAIKTILDRHRLLLDADHTLPAHGGLLRVILGAAVDARAVDNATLQQQLHPKILTMARASSGDAALWNAAVFSAPKGTGEDQLKLEREGWKATADDRFAAGVLYLQLQRGALKSNDPELIAALKQFPESGAIHRAAYEVANREGKVTRELLAADARAEFTHFSSFVAPATVMNRPRSDYLREYFAKLAKLPATRPANR